jgi:hypothetical protein
VHGVALSLLKTRNTADNEGVPESPLDYIHERKHTAELKHLDGKSTSTLYN